MKKYVCTSAEVVIDPTMSKNTYLRLTFAPKMDANMNVFAQVIQRNVVIVLSGGFFTADRKPDIPRNTQWAKTVAPTLQGQETDMEDFECPIEPYYRLDAAGNITGSVLNSMTITSFAQLDASGEIQPVYSWDALKRQAANRLANGTSMYKTVAAIEAEKEAEKQLSGIAGGVENQSPNPFAGVAGVSSPLM